MEIIDTQFEGLKVIKAAQHGDKRGFFMESFNEKTFKDREIEFNVKQVNFAKSESGVLRGLHFQTGSSSQGKLVGCIQGAVRDVAVDLRLESKTYLEHFSLDITDSSTLVLIPSGFAHGYYTLQDETLFYYAVDNFYNKESESGLRYNDPKLEIDWKLKKDPKTSEKDLKFELLK